MKKGMGVGTKVFTNYFEYISKEETSQNRNLTGDTSSQKNLGKENNQEKLE